jgi:hypothetical protein
MAELTAAETTAGLCCEPEQQATCCKPSAKADCCGANEGCGCAATGDPSPIDPSAGLRRERSREGTLSAVLERDRLGGE